MLPALLLVALPLSAALFMLLWPRLARSLHLMVALLLVPLAGYFLQQILLHGEQQWLLGGWSPLLAIR